MDWNLVQYQKYLEDRQPYNSAMDKTVIAAKLAKFSNDSSEASNGQQAIDSSDASNVQQNICSSKASNLQNNIERSEATIVQQYSVIIEVITKQLSRI